MTDFAFGFLARAAVMLPTILIVSSGFWFAMKTLGYLQLDRPFNAANLRTWPLSFVAIDAIVFGLVFAAIAAALGDGGWQIAVASGTAAIVATGGVPALASVLKK